MTSNRLRMNAAKTQVARYKAGRACFQLRQLRLVRSSLTSQAAKTLVHAFVSSRLDYCNCLLYGVRDIC